MKKRQRTKKFEQDKWSRQWQLHNNIAAFAKGLDRMPDAAQIRKDKPRTAPLTMLDMIF